MRKSIYLLAAGLTLSGLVGCKSVNMSERAEPIGRKTMVNDRRVISDAWLEGNAQVVGVNEGRTPDGLLKIQVEILNTHRDTKNFFYRFEWLDQDGMIVNSASQGWIETQISGSESKLITGIATQKNVVDFRLKLKRS